MKIESIGYRRLYDAVECSLNGAQKQQINSTVDGYYVQVYLGPDPHFGIDLTPKDTYGTPGSNFQLPSKQLKTTAESDYPRRFFTEIVCWRLLTPMSVPPPKNLLHYDVSRAKLISDAVAGALGLRIHYQTVFRFICENIVVLQGPIGLPERSEYDFLKAASFAVVKKFAIDVAHLKLTLLEATKTIIQSKSKPAMLALIWLLKVWNEVDRVATFLDLFIPLEILLSGHGANTSQAQQLDQDMLSLLTEHGGENSGAMVIANPMA